MAETPSRTRKRDECREVCLRSGVDEQAVSVSVDLLKTSSKVLANGLSSQWAEADAGEYRVEAADSDSLRLIAEILDWKEPKISSGHEAGKLAILADKYDWTPVHNRLRNAVQRDLNDIILQTRDDYLGILIAATGDDQFKKVLGHLLYMLSARVFSDGLRDDNQTALWSTYEDDGKKESLEKFWHSLARLQVRILAVICEAAIDLILAPDVQDFRALSATLESLMRKDPLDISICELLGELLTLDSVGKHSQLMEVKRKFCGEAGLSLDLAQANTPYQQALTLIGKLQQSNHHAIPFLDVEDLKSEGKVYGHLSEPTEYDDDDDKEELRMRALRNAENRLAIVIEYHIQVRRRVCES